MKSWLLVPCDGQAENLFSSNRSIWVPTKKQRILLWFHPNLKAKFKSRAPIKIYLYKKTSKTSVFWEFLFVVYLFIFLNFVFRFGICIKFCVFCTHIDLFEKKVFCYRYFLTFHKAAMTYTRKMWQKRINITSPAKSNSPRRKLYMTITFRCMYGCGK